MFRSNVPPGNLPEGWCSKQLRDVAAIYGGGRLGLTKADYVAEGVRAYSAAGPDGFVGEQEGTEPSIILSSIGARCGKSFLTDGPWATLANTQVITPNRDVAEASFLIGLLNDENYWNRSGSAQPFIKPSDVKAAWVPLPPLDEQRRIAEVLRSVDEAIVRSDAVARQSQALWHSLTESLIWRMQSDRPAMIRPLGDGVQSSDYGVNAPLGNEPSGYAVLRMGNLQDGWIDRTDLKWGEIADREAQALALEVGDILFNRTNSRDLVGKVALVREPTDDLYASYIVRLRVNREVADPHYLFAVMHSRRAQAQFKSIATPGVSQSNINPTNLKKQLIPLPPLPDQQAIASQLHAVELARRCALDDLATMRRIKADLMSDLLSGHVRVPA